MGLAFDGAAGNAHRAFRWTQATGLQSVEQWLRDNGVSVPSDITGGANGVSADGSVVVGALDSGSSFLARVGGVGGGGSGLITLDNVQNSLAWPRAAAWRCPPPARSLTARTAARCRAGRSGDFADSHLIVPAWPLYPDPEALGHFVTIAGKKPTQAAPQSAYTPAALTTLPHLAVSSRTNAPNSRPS